MGRNCCIPHCKMNASNKGTHSSTAERISFFRFPNKNNEEERKRWIDVVREWYPNAVIDEKTLICSLHWPNNATMV